MPGRPVTDADLAQITAQQAVEKAKERADQSEARGLSGPLAGTVEIEVGGKTYKVAPLNLDDLAELEGWVKSRRIAAAIVGAAGLSSGERALIVAKTAAEPVTFLDVLELRNSVIGCRRIAWLCLRKHQPGMTEADVRSMAEDLDALIGLIGQMSDLWEEPEVETKAENTDRPTDGS